MTETVSIEEIKRKHRGHWFDAGSMRFFKSRLPSYGYRKGNAIYFISSEKMDEEPRKFTIRKVDETGDVSTVGDFNIMSKNTAKKKLKEILL